MPFATRDGFYTALRVASTRGADMQLYDLFAEPTLEQPAAQVPPLRLPSLFATAQVLRCGPAWQRRSDRAPRGLY